MDPRVQKLVDDFCAGLHRAEADGCEIPPKVDAAWIILTHVQEEEGD